MEGTLEDIETDTAQLINVRMVDLGEKSNLRRSHRVVVREEEFEFEDTGWSGDKLSLGSLESGYPHS